MMNYHAHDDASSDGVGPLARHVSAARDAGIVHFCTTNHVEVLEEDGAWSVTLEEAEPRFLGEIAAAESVGERVPEVTLRVGAEFEYRPEWREPLEALAARLPLDLVVGSVHVVDGYNVSGGPEPAAYFGERCMDDAYGRYFETVLEMVEWGGFDVLGHLDLVTRYGHDHYGRWEAGRHEEAIRAVLDAAAGAGIGVEVNASGVAQAPGRPYPCATILGWAREARVPFLTVGADSHRPEHVARGLDVALEAASRAGWEELALFERREPTGALRVEDALAGLRGGA